MYLFRGILIGLLFGMPVGAVGAMTVQRTLHYDVRAGLLTGLGSSVADFLYAVVGAFGLTVVSDFLLDYQTVIHVLGGTLVLLMGLRLVVRKDAAAHAEAPPANGIRMFLASFAVGITNGNSETLADAFLNGAKDAGNEVEKVCLYDKTIGFCRGCLACLGTHRCVIRDDADTIAQKMRSAEVLVFATPVYYYEMCGQMKTMLDRANPLYGSDYKFRDVYLLATATEKEESAMDGAIKGMSGWVECFPKAKLAGTVFGGGASGIGAIQGHPALTKAYEMGKSV